MNKINNKKPEIISKFIKKTEESDELLDKLISITNLKTGSEIDNVDTCSLWEISNS